MLKNLHTYNDILANPDCLPVPRGSFITLFNPPFIDKEGKRCSYAKTMIFNKNLFMYHKDINRVGFRISSENPTNQNDLFTIYVVFPGESNINLKRFLCKSDTRYNIVFLSIKALNEFPIKLYSSKVIFMFVNFNS